MHLNFHKKFMLNFLWQNYSILNNSHTLGLNIMKAPPYTPLLIMSEEEGLLGNIFNEHFVKMGAPSSNDHFRVYIFPSAF